MFSSMLFLSRSVSSSQITRTQHAAIASSWFHAVSY